MERHHDVFTQHAPEHGFEGDDGFVEIDGFDLDGLFPCKDQQLPHQFAGALGCIDDESEVLPDADFGIRQFILDQQPVSENGGEHVVQIVGDPAGKLPERLEFACLMKFCFEQS